MEVSSSTKPLILWIYHSHHKGNAVQHEDGAFGNFIAAKGDIQIKIPENMSFEEAATLGVGISTSVNLPFNVIRHD